MAKPQNLPQKINKTDLIKTIAKNTATSVKVATAFYNALEDAIFEGLQIVGQVVLSPQLGKLFLQELQARKGVIPGTKQKINIPRRTVCRFQASTFLKTQVKKLR